MARALWPGQDPIGKIVLGACAPERHVVGVVGDVRHLALEQASGNEMYLPHAAVRRSTVGRSGDPIDAAPTRRLPRRVRDGAASRSRRTWPATSSERCSSWWTSLFRRDASSC